MHKAALPYLIRLFSSSFLTWKVKDNEKKIYLTFDDGPSPDVTDKILEILKKYDIKATFFCVGAKAHNFPVLFLQIKNDGHQTGNHTFSHLNGWKTCTKEYIADTLKAGNIIISNLFRPPYGKITPLQIFKLQKQFKIVMWSVLSGDFDKNITREKCLENVVRHSKPGSIVLFHDSEKSAEKCIYALPRFIEHFLEKGFGFDLL